jgi:nucleoside-diphosphate-sugar epimerase
MLTMSDRGKKAILLTGATGFIGGYLRRALEPDPVILLGRKKPPLLPNERWSHVDLAEPVAPEELEGGEVLCHLAHSMGSGRENITYHRHLLDAANTCPNIKRVVLVSSMSVYSGNAEAVVDEETPCDPVGEYPKTKLACEKLWQEGLREDCALTVLRPSEVIGPDGVGLRTLIRHALHRPVVGAIKRSVLCYHSVHYVAVSNVASAIRFCLRHPQASMRETYIVSDDHYPENESYATMQDLVRSIAGKRPLPSLALPRWMVRILGSLTGRPLLGLKQVFSSQKIHDAGFEDATSLRDEVKRMVQAVEKQAHN